MDDWSMLDLYCDGWDRPEHRTDQETVLVAVFGGDELALCPRCLAGFRVAEKMSVEQDCYSGDDAPRPWGEDI